MPRPDPSPGRPPGRPPEGREPGAGQAALDGLGDLADYRPASGSMARAVESSIAAARDAGRLGAIEFAISALAVEQARALDLAAGRRDPYAMTQASRALLSILDRLGLAPAAAPAAPTPGGGELDAFLAGLRGPQVGDAEVA